MSNVLAVGAHPDDVEFSCGGTLLWHRQRGDKVVIVHATSSGYINTITGERLRTPEQSKEESKKSAEILDCHFYQLDFNEQVLEFGIELITKIEEIILKEEIDLVYTHGIKDPHQDHRAVHRSVMAASRSVHNIFCFEQLPLPRVRHNDNPNYFVDITDFFERKMDACKAHKSQIEKYGDKILHAMKALSIFRGSQVGCEFAEAFLSIKQFSE